MNQVSVGILTLGCAVLCLGVAGLLRRITDVKLALGGYNGEIRQFMVDIGRMLPEPVIAELPDPEMDALLVVASRSCETCHRLAGEVEALSGQVLVGVLPGDGPGLDTGDVPLLSEEATERLATEFDLSQIPVVIAQREGYVVGAAYGETLVADGGLTRFWRTITDHPVEVTA
jgi:hypothetical protein